MNLARSGSIYLVGNVLSAAVPFLLLPLLTRVLAPEGYGLVVSFFILVAVFTPVAGLSVHGALGVAWFQKPKDEIPAFVAAALNVALLTTLGLAGIVVLGALLPDVRMLQLPPAVAALAAVVAGGNVLMQCRLVLWQSQNRPLANVAMQVSNSVANITLSLVGVLVLAWGAYGRIAGAVVSIVLMALIAVLLLRREGLVAPDTRRGHYRELVRFGGFLIPHGLAGALLSNADRLLVAALLGAGAVGTYGAAAQLGSIMAIIADAFVKAFNPWLFARLALREQQGNHLLAVGAMYAMAPVFALVGLCVWSGLSLFGPLFLGPEYQSALSLLPWFVLGGVFSGIYLAVSGLYFYQARTGLLSAISFTTVAVGFLCTALLLRRYGVNGAAAGYALVQGLLALAAWLVALNQFDLPWNQPMASLRAAWRTVSPARGNP